MTPANEIRALLGRLTEIADRLPDDPVTDKEHATGEFVTEKKLSGLTGFSVDSLARLRNGSHGTKTIAYGTHWFVTPTGRIIWNVQEFYTWVQSGEQTLGRKSTDKPPGSGLHGKGSDDTTQHNTRPLNVV